MPALGALFRSKLPRSHWLKNFRKPRRHFERTASLEQGRPASILWLARTLPAMVLEAEMPRFSNFFRARARSVLTSCEVCETLAGATFFTHRSIRATTQHRRKSLRERIRWCLTFQMRLNSAPGWSGNVREAARGRFWTSPGRSWPVRGTPRSALGRHLGVQKPSRACPDTAPKRP